MKKYLNWLSDLAPEKLSHALKTRFASEPISTVGELSDFVQTRSAYVAQTSLFGYLKERMGISYPRYFQDDVFVGSIRTAQMAVYRACAADLAIFAAAFVAVSRESAEGEEEALTASDTAALATMIFDYAIKNSGSDHGDDPAPDIAAFGERAARTIWRQAAVMDNAFTESPPRLVRWAPIADELKRFDTEIIVNSIRFRWRDIREQFRKRVKPAMIRADFLAGGQEAPSV